MTEHRETRSIYIQRLVARGGGFRAVTMQPWSSDKIAREVVRLNAQTSDDEVDLLQMLYVDIEPEIQTTFVEAAGVKHDGAKIDEDLEPPYADADTVLRAAKLVSEKFGEDGVQYLRTIERYNHAGWPGLDLYLAELDAGR